eukprot:7215408-Alexandrium_andersonii.AAC.1
MQRCQVAQGLRIAAGSCARPDGRSTDYSRTWEDVYHARICKDLETRRALEGSAEFRRVEQSIAENWSPGESHSAQESSEGHDGDLQEPEGTRGILEGIECPWKAVN